MNEAYQEIIEYYSRKNIPYFELYIEKMSKLYQRPDVQLVIGENDNVLLTKKEQRKSGSSVKDDQKNDKKLE